MFFSYSFHTTVVSDGLHEPYLLLTNSSFILILSDSHRGCLIWVKFGSNLSLFSDKVRCFDQSKRALYGNFIINPYCRSLCRFSISLIFSTRESRSLRRYLHEFLAQQIKVVIGFKFLRFGEDSLHFGCEVVEDSN